jgi:four helix bundle protein
MGTHKDMIIWKNYTEISKMIFENIVIAIPKTFYDLRDQIERAATSIGANFIEGYYAGSTKEFTKFLGYSRRSIAELIFWMDNCNQRNMLNDPTVDKINDILIKTGYLVDKLIISLRAKTKKPL